MAATRARDLLVVPTLGDEPWEGGWLQPLNPALYPVIDSRREGRRGPGCPAFKSRDSVLRRPNDETAAPSTVSPGEHTFGAGYSVVWWDPNALDLEKKPPFGVRREDLIVKDVPRHVVADGRGEYDRWVLARGAARESGSVPSCRVQTVREAAEAATTALHEIRILDVRDPAELERTGGVNFGALVHELLARASFDASAESLVDLALLHARLLDLAADEASAAAKVAHRALAVDLMKRAHAADQRGACRRETPVTLRQDDGTLVEGTIDLAFEEAGRWTVVDFKTDRELLARTPSYVRQVQLYADAVAAATGSPADAVIMQI